MRFVHNLNKFESNLIAFVYWNSPELLQLLSIIQAAGWPIWPLIICSILAVALIIERLIQLRVRRVIPVQTMDKAIHLTSTAIGTIALAAPLLGLLGTVIGMIEIFGAQSPSRHLGSFV